MDSKIPTIDLCKADLKPGSAEWESTRNQVIQAFQEYGCFEVVYDKVEKDIRKAIFDASKEIFEFPIETKLKNLSDKPSLGYKGLFPTLPSFESLAIADLLQPQGVENFAKIFWPDGNDEFCNIVRTFSEPVMELYAMLTRMILESLGIERYIDEVLGSSIYHLRFSSFKQLEAKAEDGKNNNKLGLSGHTDGGWLTIISQNSVNGLQFQKKDGEWMDANISPNSYAVLAGDAFMAWTNSRLHSPVHRVTMTGNGDRLSVQMFSVPKADYIIEARKELVDEEHPVLYKQFGVEDYFAYLVTKEGAKAGTNAFKTFCGV
ncbi:unnamed protein product [Withania somnifera]